MGAQGRDRWARALAVVLSATLVAGCEAILGPTPAPTIAPSAPAATPSPAGPTPTSGATVALAVLDGLTAFATDPDTTFRVTFKGTSRHSADTLRVEGRLDVSGDDASIKATFQFPRKGKGRTEYRRIDGRDWVRFDRGHWGSMAGPDPDEVADPFAAARAGGSVQFLGPVDGDPDHYRVELAAVYLHPALIPAGNLTAEKITRTKLILVTDATGRPVSGTWSLHGQGRVSGQLQAIAIDLELTFLAVGGKITIKEP